MHREAEPALASPSCATLLALRKPPGPSRNAIGNGCHPTGGARFVLHLPLHLYTVKQKTERAGRLSPLALRFFLLDSEAPPVPGSRGPRMAEPPTTRPSLLVRLRDAR